MGEGEEVEAAKVAAVLVLREAAVAAGVLPHHPTDPLSPRRLLAEHIRSLRNLQLVPQALLLAFTLQGLAIIPPVP